MTISLIILACLLWAASILALGRKPVLGPALSFLGLLALSQARIPTGIPDLSYPAVPLNATILMVWACMTLVVMLTTMLQPEPVKAQNRGWAYMTVGAIAGLAVGLLASTLSAAPSVLYAGMVTGIIAGVFFGFLIFSRTPRGEGVALRSGRFFSYLLAKGFPIAITIMMPGVACVLALLAYPV